MILNYPCKYILLIFTLVFTSQANAQFVISNEDIDASIDQLEYYLDPEHQYTIESITNAKFEKSNGNLNFGVDAVNIWIKIKVKNNTSRTDWKLQFVQPTLDSVVFYYQDTNGSWKQNRKGDLTETEETARYRYPVFDLTIPSKETKRFYFRIASKGSIQIPIRISSPELFNNTLSLESLLFGGFFGVIIIMTFYNGFLFFSTRYRSYLLYCIYLLLFALAHFSLNGQVSQFFDNVPFFFKQEWIVFTIVLGNVFVTWFAYDFLETWKYSKFWSVFLKSYLLVCIIIAILVFVVDYLLVIKMVSFISMAGNLMLVVSGIHIYLLGNKIARFYILGWFLLFSGLILYNLWLTGILEGPVFLRNINQVGATLEILVLSIALSDRINILKDQKDSAIQEAFELAVKNENLVIEQNKTLEIQVAKRTKEIYEKQQEIEAQNEEIVAQNEEMHLQKHKIEEQNLTLNRSKTQLENKVEIRTRELKESNQELIKFNTQLQQFSFIVAHNLKAPIARLLGLSGIFDRKHEDVAHNIVVLDKLYDATKELEQVIKDLNYILELQSGRDLQKTSVDIRKIYETVSQLLTKEIEQSNAEIITQFELRNFLSVPAYMESILLNLIGNAIKYRSEKALRIQVKCLVKEGVGCIEVEDNGIGMDMSVSKGKIFQPYQRFSENIEGKGLGLFLVKTQAQLLQGEVEVYSEIEKGTKFVVRFKI